MCRTEIEIFVVFYYFINYNIIYRLKVLITYFFFIVEYLTMMNLFTIGSKIKMQHV